MINAEKAKAHFKKNKNVYIGTGVGIVVGGMVVFVLKSGVNKATIDSFKLINWKSPHTSQTIQVTIPRMGNSGNAVQCLENGVIYPSQNAAAKALNLNPSTVSKYLNGMRESADGFTFDKVTESGIQIAS